MLYIISIFFISIGLVKKDSKLIFSLLLLIIIILFAGNTHNPDFYNYLENYNQKKAVIFNNQFEFGFQQLNRLCYTLGLSYNQFLLLVTIIGYSLINSTISLFTKNKLYVYTLYFVYPFLFDVVQIRNFLAMSVIIYGSRYIITYQKNYIKFIIYIFIAASFHITSYFYLLILLIQIKNNKILFISIVSFTIIGILFLPIFEQLLQSFLPNVKIIKYFHSNTSIITKLGIIIYFGFSLVLVFTAKKKVEWTDKNSSFPNENNLLTHDDNTGTNKLDVEAIYKINIICLFSIFLVVTNLSFFRLYRNIFILNYILYGIALVKMKKNYKYYLFSISILIFTLFSFFYLIIFAQGASVFGAIFNNNLVF